MGGFAGGEESSSLRQLVGGAPCDGDVMGPRSKEILSSPSHSLLLLIYMKRLFILQLDEFVKGRED